MKIKAVEPSGPLHYRVEANQEGKFALGTDKVAFVLREKRASGGENSKSDFAEGED